MNKQNLFPTKWSTAIFIAIVILAGSVFAVGQTERVVYEFQGGSYGYEPSGGLISDHLGNFYGATFLGGRGGRGKGTIFQLSRPAGQGGHWTESVLYSFTGGYDGAAPFGELIFDHAGNLYGIGQFGGYEGGGVVFELKPQGATWKESVIYNFSNSDSPVGGLAFDKAGNLYFATRQGGKNGEGSVIQLAPLQGGWAVTLLHSFRAGNGGTNPVSGPIVGNSGDLFGLTNDGGQAGDFGHVYELKAPATRGGTWTARVLYAFQSVGDGLWPIGRLVFDREGNLYGATLDGGASNSGNIFELTRQGDSWSKTELYAFCGQSNCTDGALPNGSLIFDGKGNLYGTTENGGNYCTVCGVVFELTPPATQGGTWTETVIYSFDGLGNDPYEPMAGLTRGKYGRLWGTTVGGGAVQGGTVFKILP